MAVASGASGGGGGGGGGGGVPGIGWHGYGLSSFPPSLAPLYAPIASEMLIGFDWMKSGVSLEVGGRRWG